MEVPPIVLLSSSSDFYKLQDFVKSILNASTLPAPKIVSDSIESYEWHFETKYYETTIQLCISDKRIIGNKDSQDLVEAFIHFFDPNSSSSFDEVNSWLPFVQDIQPEVLMLVCTTSKDSDVIGRKVVQEWCVQHGFELLELQPEQEVGEAEDFPDISGVSRIIQALQNHTWTNLKKKGPSATEEEMGDEFENLFMKLKDLKVKTESMSPDERKAYAEKVVISFWKAIGGDEEEIEGLDDEDEG